MSRTPLLAGNWKMNLALDEAVQLAAAVVESCRGLAGREVMVAPAFLHIPAVARVLQGTSVLLAGQNMCWEKRGAFTGEVSGPMLKEAGASMVILGHSERRHVFGEDDELINRRLRGALACDLTPILCLGETLEEREADQIFEVLEGQLLRGLGGLDPEEANRVVLAYEPVWAIGTGRTAGPEQAREVHAFLRSVLADRFEKTLAESVRILYGGSVNPENIDSLMAEPDIDGALVGGAALKSESFDRIIHFAS